MMQHGVRAWILKAARHVAVAAGYRIERPPAVEKTFAMAGLLARAAQRGMNFGTIIDVGASDGKWSVRAAAHFPGAHFLLVEPLSEREQELAALRKAQPQFDYALCAVGETSGETPFHVSDDLDGSGIGGAGAPAATRTVPLQSIDSLVRERNLRGPFLLKLDTHGFEVPILAGARETLRQTSLLIVEVYNFKISDCCLRFHEMCSHLEALGFRCCDLADPMRRPKDGMLWQMDFAFMAADSPAWESASYR